MKKSIHVLAALVIAASAGVSAQTAPSTASAASPAASTTMTEGEVRKIDKAQGKLTLRHGPIRSLEMPAMTMVFKAADPGMLDTLEVGAKVMFAAEKAADGAITVTKIEAAR